MCALYRNSCAGEFTVYCIYNTVLLFQGKHKHRHLLLHTHDRCSQIHSSKLLRNYLVNTDLIVFHSIRIRLRIAVVDTVNCLCKKNRFCLDFYCAQYSGCICGEVRMTCSSCKEYHLTLSKALFCCILGIKTCKCTAGKRCEDLCL